VSARANEFARRRAALQLQCALQRDQFAQSAADIGATLHFVDRGLSIVRSTRIVPMIIAAASTLGILSRSSGVMRLVGRGWLVMKTLQGIKRALR
jgi:hypothetical protein